MIEELWGSCSPGETGWADLLLAPSAWQVEGLHQIIQWAMATPVVLQLLATAPQWQCLPAVGHGSLGGQQSGFLPERPSPRKQNIGHRNLSWMPMRGISVLGSLVSPYGFSTRGLASRPRMCLSRALGGQNPGPRLHFQPRGSILCRDTPLPRHEHFILFSLASPALNILNKGFWKHKMYLSFGTRDTPISKMQLWVTSWDRHRGSECPYFVVNLPHPQ